MLIIVACMFITFLIIDTQNKAMEFIESDLSKQVMAVWCVLSVATALALVVMQRRAERANAKHTMKSEQNSGLTQADKKLESALENALAELRAKNK